MRTSVIDDGLPGQFTAVTLALGFGLEAGKAHAGEWRMAPSPQGDGPQGQTLADLAVIVASMETGHLRADLGKTRSHEAGPTRQHGGAAEHHYQPFEQPDMTRAAPAGRFPGLTGRHGPAFQPDEERIDRHRKRHPQQGTPPLRENRGPQTGSNARPAQKTLPGQRSAQHQLQGKNGQQGRQVGELDGAGTERPGTQMAIGPRDVQPQILPAGHQQGTHPAQGRSGQQPAVRVRPTRRQRRQQYPGTQQADEHLVPVACTGTVRQDVQDIQRRIGQQWHRHGPVLPQALAQRGQPVPVTSQQTQQTDRSGQRRLRPGDGKQCEQVHRQQAVGGVHKRHESALLAGRGRSCAS